ncbi:hypothetical protein KY321_04100 [Candidatus Woesearchaeota archaeon]|nr:hypothetical protein [Candidatus Woesearchaeota archaeon]
MVWQDIAISIANILFAFSLLNQVVYSFKCKETSITYITSGLTVLGLTAMTIAYVTLSLYLSAASSGINCVLWSILLIQRIIY